MQHAVIESLSEEDYLHGERVAPAKHEFVAGEVFAMAGASKTHGTLALNAALILRNHLRGGPCRTWIADMKVRVAAASAYYYPDVVVSCDPRDLAADAPQDYLEHPGLIVEVLSPATEHIDRREKLLAYRRLESLTEYVLVDQEKPWVEVYRRTEAGWTQDICGPGEVAELVSVDARLSMTELYADSGVAAGEAV